MLLLTCTSQYNIFRHIDQCQAASLLFKQPTFKLSASGTTMASAREHLVRRALLKRETLNPETIACRSSTAC
jgi:hypothetical protein